MKNLLQIAFNPLYLYHTLLPYLYTAAYVFSIIQSRAGGHQVPPSSASLLFFTSLQLQTENVFPLMHISPLATWRSHVERDILNMEGGCSRTLMRLSAKNCFKENASGLFLPHTFSQLCQDLKVVLLVYRLVWGTQKNTGSVQ